MPTRSHLGLQLLVEVDDLVALALHDVRDRLEGQPDDVLDVSPLASALFWWGKNSD